MTKEPLGIITGNYTGEQLARVAANTFGTDKITPEQFSLLLDYMIPSSYITRFYRIKKGEQAFKFSVPNYGNGDISKALSHRPWQRQIANDIFPNLTVIKSRQLGFSELFIAFMIWWVDAHAKDSVNALYAFPTLKQMRDFVQMRLDPVLNTVPYFKSLMGEVNSVEVKQIRNSFITFRTSSVPRSVEGVNADMVLLDEYDHVLPDAEQSAINSMASSPFKVLRRWSTPSVTGMGVEDLYSHSDQFEYLHKCKYCGYDNMMSFDDYNPTSPDKGGNVQLVNPDGVNLTARIVEPDAYRYVCKHCGKPLDRWYNGRWVARKPDRTLTTGGIRGYRISKMNAVWISASQLKASELNSKSKQEFYNYDLGMPYEDQNLKVMPSDIYQCGVDRLPTEQDSRGDYKFILVGIDWGVKHTVVIGGLNSQLELDIIDTFQIQGDDATTGNAGDDIRRLRARLAPYSPDLIVADVGDSGDKIHALMGLYGKDKVFGCKYSSNPNNGLYGATGQLEPTWNRNSNLVTVDKLVQHKRFIGLLKEKKIGIWKAHDNALNFYVKNWENVVIRNEEQSNGETRQVITRKTLGGVKDDAASASIYVLQGLDYIRNTYYGTDSYNFDYDILNSVKPEETEINKNLTSNGNIY
ncbi:phage terminase large subunit family protein [Lactobacillus amylolyticus]|uniref:phage terminase large subunit family protein n=1 Tax=Lactobacillus amylolyticus TaxID=83683 RepID=UPI0024936E2F|nr:phage terminase large subunit family protein [Lactobacillus amylolyticus]